MNRDFKGIWTPREIWLHPDLSPMDKLIWSEINSLFDREKGGCYASNDYLASFFRVTERYIRERISHLKKLNLIKEISFNGRIRVIVALYPEQDLLPEPSSYQTGTTVPGRDELQFRSARNHSSGPSYIDKKEDKKTNISNTTTTSTEPPPTAIASAKGGGGGTKNYFLEKFDLHYTNTKGERCYASEQDIFSYFIKKPEYPPEILHEAIRQANNTNNLIGDVNKYLEAICERLINAKSHEKEKNTKSKSLHKQKEPPIPKYEGPKKPIIID